MIDQKVLQENIITALGLDKLPDEKKAKLVEKMSKLVEKRLILRLMDALTDEDFKEFEKMSDKDDKIKADFLTGKIPNIIDIIQEEVVKVKNEMLDAGLEEPEIV